MEITDPVQRQKLTDLPLRFVIGEMLLICSKKALIIQQYHIKVKTDSARKRSTSIDEAPPNMEEPKKEKKSKKISQQVIQGIGKGLRRFTVGSSSSPGSSNSEKRKSTYIPSTSKPKKEEKLQPTPPPLPPMPNNDLFKCSNCKQDLLPLAEKCEACGHVVDEKKRKASGRFSHPVSHLLGKVLHQKK